MRALNGQKGPLERPMTRRALIEDIAKTSQTQDELAAKYGVTQGAISKFSTRHEAEITIVRMDAANKYAGILITQQSARMAAYQELFDMVAAMPDTANRALAAKLLRQVAEEMGHLPGRVTLSGEVGTRTTYDLPGIDPEDLT